MRIALINLPSPFLISDKVFPPLGILYIASALRDNDYDVKFYDFAGKKLTEVEEDTVFITITSPQIRIAIDYVKQYCKGKKTVIGGCGVDSLSEVDKSYFTMIVKGEAENCVNDIMNKLSNSSGKYLLYNSTSFSDIELVSFPARSLINGYEYRINGRNTTTMITSRGCPYSCIYCISGNSKKLRIASADRVCEEIDEIYNLDYEGLMIFDDIFTLNKQRLKIIGSHIKRKNMVYRCFSHVRFVDEELCEILSNTNCKEVGIGIESGSNKILKTIKKGFTRDQSIKAVTLLKSYGVRVKTFFMIGLPGEDDVSIVDTKFWVEEVKPDDIDFSIYSPYPETEIWNNKKNYDIRWNGGDPVAFKGRFGKYSTNISTSKLTSSELIKYRDQLESVYKHASKSPCL